MILSIKSQMIKSYLKLYVVKIRSEADTQSKVKLQNPSTNNLPCLCRTMSDRPLGCSKRMLERW